MNTLKKLITLIFLSLLLSACDNKDSHTSKKQEEVYDFRNEKYQDFYSRFMREVERRNLNAITPNDSFERPFTKEYINEVLGLDIKEDIHFKLVINRVNPKFNNYKKRNHLDNESDILELKNHEFDKLSDYEICSDNLQIEGLFCLNRIRRNNVEYYFLPKKSTKKIPYINQNIDFYCESIDSAHGKYTNCKLLNFPDNPYNLDIWINFSKNPQDFFHIIKYVESYIYQATGEHIWQTSLKEN